MSMPVLLSLHYLPCIAWFQHALQAPSIVLECHEHYIKQSYRNRCKILGAQGIQDLIIPVQKGAQKLPVSQVLLQDLEPWRRIHWHAIRSAYGKSPYYIHYAPKLEPFYLHSTHRSLVDFNQELIQLLFALLKVEPNIGFTQAYEKEPLDKLDLRNYFGAKGEPSASELLQEKTYYQNFSDKFPFQANLSILDLIFQLGPQSKDFLT